MLHNTISPDMVMLFPGKFLPYEVIFIFSPPISVEQASILDYLGFLFCFDVISVGNQMLPLSIDITEDWSTLV